MLGDAASGKTTLLSNLGLNALGEQPDRERLEAHPPCHWWLFERGMVLDIAGNVLFQADTHDEEDGRWRSLLRLLRRYRPARPLDGVILTLSCTDLIRQATPGAGQLPRIKDKAASLSKKLAQAQRMLGRRFLVYILVTKCDQIHGFQSLYRNLPASHHQDIFGWSNPYAMDTAYAPAWVDEAFHHLCWHLVQTQSDVFATCQEVHDGDGLFLFPTAFQKLQEPLRLYLDQLFMSTGAHAPCFFRGLYFCGDGGGEATTSPYIKPVFLRHLFAHKIFPEYGLARHVARRLTSARWEVRIAQALLIVFMLVAGLGLWSASRHLSATAHTLVPALTQLATDVVLWNRWSNKTSQITQPGTRQRQHGQHSCAPWKHASTAPPERCTRSSNSTVWRPSLCPIRG
jgi:type VI secretion system protein ImpL